MNLAKKIATLHIQAKKYNRIVYTPSPITSFRNVKQETPRSAIQKPKGLWYECNKGWKEFVQYEFRHKIEDYNHKYSLEVNLSRMCVIRTEKEMERFSYEYGFQINGRWGIDWAKVSVDFDGIEICPSIYDSDDMFDWYEYWDIASGCIWGSGALKSLTEVDNDIGDEEFKSEWN